MKITIPLPDDLFRLADEAARRMRVSRSQLYATALSEFLERQRTDEITAGLNEVYSRRAAKVDAASHRAQLKSIDQVSW